MEAQQRQPWKNFGKDSKRAAVELWRAGVPWATIRKQLKMFVVYPEEDSGPCQEELHLAGPKDAGGGFPTETCAVHASEAPGGDCQWWWHDQILNWMYKQEIYDFSTFSLFYHWFCVGPVNTFRVFCTKLVRFHSFNWTSTKMFSIVLPFFAQNPSKNAKFCNLHELTKCSFF